MTDPGRDPESWLLVAAAGLAPTVAALAITQIDGLGLSLLGPGGSLALMLLAILLGLRRSDERRH